METSRSDRSAPRPRTTGDKEGWARGTFLTLTLEWQQIAKLAEPPSPPVIGGVQQLINTLTDIHKMRYKSVLSRVSQSPYCNCK